MFTIVYGRGIGPGLEAKPGMLALMSKPDWGFGLVLLIARARSSFAITPTSPPGGGVGLAPPRVEAPAPNANDSLLAGVTRLAPRYGSRGRFRAKTGRLVRGVTSRSADGEPGDGVYGWTEAQRFGFELMEARRAGGRLRFGNP